MKIIVLVFLFACGDNATLAPDASPDASPYPSCLSLGCDYTKIAVDRVCADTGVCYCKTDGKGPLPPVRCNL